MLRKIKFKMPLLPEKTISTKWLILHKIMNAKEMQKFSCKLKNGAIKIEKAKTTIVSMYNSKTPSPWSYVNIIFKDRLVGVSKTLVFAIIQKTVAKNKVARNEIIIAPRYFPMINSNRQIGFEIKFNRDLLSSSS